EMLKYGSSLPVIFFIGLFLILVAAILAIVGAVMLMVCYYRLGKAFGRQGGFLVGMVLLPVVFMSIIAFSRDEYQGNYEGYAPNQGYNPYGQGGYGQGYNNQGYGNPGYDNRMNNQQGYPGQAEPPYNTQPYPQPGFDQTQAGSMGSTAGAAGAADISGASATDTSNAAGTARFCRECGNRLQPGAKFCNNCGKPVL
ncbi:MAG: zinc-ribbon domain-containing protein, partial [Eubacterium sp.]|nr:zinc-ribbon domain-containing protein [Eubacterium sp.]